MERIARALDARREVAFDLVRVYLGIGLVVRGGLFIGHPEPVLSLIEKSGDWFWPFAIVHGVALAHIAGGLMLAAGLFTRVAAAIQIPAVFGAVFFVHLGEGLFSTGQSLELSLLVLFLLGLYTLFGSGRFALDAHLARTMNAADLPHREFAHSTH